MTPVVFLDPAEEEMLEAAAYYEDRADGLGDHCIAEVQYASTQSNALWKAPNQVACLKETSGADYLEGFHLVYCIESKQRR